ncbi:MAG TPA: PQQ-binding-like beta-propeller repeat protein [Bryobacteraceae bacterium]|nr:PQQ-binding-like beta-propeller repeat protein [Bryobacteraceae bacterium]
MKNRHAVLLIGLFPALTYAQFGRGGGDWMTAGSDAQRSSWVRTDAKISPASLLKGGFDITFKIAADPSARESLAAPLTLNSYIGYRGFRSLVFLGATADKVIGVDTDLGRVEWRRELPVSGASPCASAAVAITRPTTAAFPGQPGGRGFGPRGGAAKSGVGQPLEGAVTIREIAANMPGPGGPPPGRANTVRGANAGRGPLPGFGRMPSILDVVGRDGMLHSIYVSNGEGPNPPLRFVPANTRLIGLMNVDNVVYAAAGQGCDAAPGELVALDLESKQLAAFRPDSGAIAGTDGFAMGPDGTVYAATTGGDLIALEPKTLQRKQTYRAGQPFATSPVLFQHGEQTWIAAATQDGRIHVLDAAALSTPLASSAATGSPVRSLATWQDPSGGRWILGPAAGAVVAWKVADTNDGATLQPGWTSRDLTAPLAPIVVNGVVFTASTGASPVLYALDGATGQELWNSGRKIGSAIRGGGLSAGNSQVFLSTSDGTFYAFGFPIEH